jgi:hypothetical protein
MAGVASLTRPKSTRTDGANTSPLRAELAALITARDSGRERLEALSAAAASGDVYRAENACATARAAAQDAANLDLAKSTEALIAGTPPPDPVLPAAQAALQAAENQLTDAKAARETARVAVEGLRATEASRERRIDEAVKAVIDEEVPKSLADMIVQFEAMKRTLIDHGLAISVLSHATFKPGPRSDASRAANCLDIAPRIWGLPMDIAANSNALAWEQAIAGLRINAETALPA